MFAWCSNAHSGSLSCLSADYSETHNKLHVNCSSHTVVTRRVEASSPVKESVEKYLDKGYSYSRTNNPTVTALEEKLAKVENGFGSSAFGTGMAATTSAISATMQAGDHCVISDCSYGGTNRSCREFFTPLNMEFDFVDFRDPENVKKAMKPNTKLVFSETPANPVLRGPWILVAVFFFVCVCVCVLSTKLRFHSGGVLALCGCVRHMLVQGPVAAAVSRFSVSSASSCKSARVHRSRCRHLQSDAFQKHVPPQELKPPDGDPEPPGARSLTDIEAVSKIAHEASRSKFFGRGCFGNTAADLRGPQEFGCASI
ncbi:metB [Symbiodinium sp. CCMP2592]|nr:metB [Symbiodinium sp. CCMP2592]